MPGNSGLLSNKATVRHCFRSTIRILGGVTSTTKLIVACLNMCFKVSYFYLLFLVFI